MADVETIRLVEIGDDRRVPVRAVLDKASSQGLDDVMIIGRTDDGDLWAESTLNAGQSLWLLEKLRERILAGNPWSIV